MGDIYLFSVNGNAQRLPAHDFLLEKELQTLIESNMELFFDVEFLQSEFVATDGRMDSIGLDKNNRPVIFEYKRGQNENVIAQGLFYLNWLMEHKGAFKLLVLEKLGMERASCIDWSSPCVMCVASGFGKYDLQAVNQVQRDIRLIRYTRFGETYISFEWINTPLGKPSRIMKINSPQDITPQKKSSPREARLQTAAFEQRTLYSEITKYILALGTDMKEIQLTHNTVFRKKMNIYVLAPHNKGIRLRMRMDPSLFQREQSEGFLQCVHEGFKQAGAIDSQVIICSEADFEKAKPLIDKCYQIN